MRSENTISLAPEVYLGRSRSPLLKGGVQFESATMVVKDSTQIAIRFN